MNFILFLKTWTKSHRSPAFRCFISLGNFQPQAGIMAKLYYGPALAFLNQRNLNACMTPLLIAVGIALASIIVGLLPIYTRLKKIQTRYFTAFAAGVLVSTAIFELLPEAFSMGQATALPLALGFFLFYFLEKILLIHACGEKDCELEAHSVGWLGIFGLSAENFVDGISIAAAFQINPSLAFLVAFAIIAHEIPHSLSIFGIMRAARKKKNEIIFALVLTAALFPIGALASGGFPAELLPLIIAFVAGNFIYVGAADLLPTAHKKFNLKVVTAVICGAAIIPLLEIFLGI